MGMTGFGQAVEAALLVQLMRGERAGQAELFRRFKTPVYNLALRICQCPEEAADAMQDAFIKAFDRIHQFRGDAFGGWFKRIVVNECLSRLRRIKRRETPTAILDDADVGRSPGAQMDLAQAFAALPPDTRAVVWLYDVEGYSHKEIAEMFGRSVSFSKTQLSRAHARMRAELGEQGGDDLCPIATH